MVLKYDLTEQPPDDGLQPAEQSDRKPAARTAYSPMLSAAAEDIEQKMAAALLTRHAGDGAEEEHDEEKERVKLLARDIERKAGKDVSELLAMLPRIQALDLLLNVVHPMGGRETAAVPARIRVIGLFEKMIVEVPGTGQEAEEETWTTGLLTFCLTNPGLVQQMKDLLAQHPLPEPATAEPEVTAPGQPQETVTAKAVPSLRQRLVSWFQSIGIWPQADKSDGKA